MFDWIYIFTLTFWFSNAVTNILRQHYNKGKWKKMKQIISVEIILLFTSIQ